MDNRHLQSTTEDGANGGLERGETQGAEEATGSALELDEHGGGTVLAQDADQLSGVSSEGLSLGGQVSNGRNKSNNGANGALDGREVKTTEETEDVGAELDGEDVAVEVGDLHNVVDDVALHDSRSETLESANEVTDKGTDLRETETGNQVLNSGGELDQGNGALGGGNGHEARAKTLQVTETTER